MTLSGRLLHYLFDCTTRIEHIGIRERGVRQEHKTRLTKMLSDSQWPSRSPLFGKCLFEVQLPASNKARNPLRIDCFHDAIAVPLILQFLWPHEDEVLV